MGWFRAPSQPPMVTAFLIDPEADALRSDGCSTGADGTAVGVRRITVPAGRLVTLAVAGRSPLGRGAHLMATVAPIAPTALAMNIPCFRGWCAVTASAVNGMLTAAIGNGEWAVMGAPVESCP